MPSLASKFRKDLENAVKQARRAAETGAGKALDLLAVGHHEPWGSLKPEQRRLRNRLRAHGVQLGDVRDDKRGTQSITRLTGEVAYEHWHRMLFARYLAENDLLIEPESGQAMTMDECRELAREQGKDWLPVACGYAQQMLPEIFRQDDPVLEVALPPETRSELEDVLNELPRDVFLASDSLGWVYQFWQADQKDTVNKSEKKIGADELPAVTQLFTEDYMVDFLLDNTLGAWWAGKQVTLKPQLSALGSEAELRAAIALPGCPWNYLRFVKGADGKWAPAAGTFAGWPKTAAAIRALDPCMGSGHFVVAMFGRLAALRQAEEKLDESAAVAAVIRDNLFGLEIDPRCTQIAAFNLALAAWRRAGYRPLPAMNLACSGLSPNTREVEWIKIAGDDEKIQRGMERLYRLFQKASVLGSLINPRGGEDDLLVAAFHELQPVLEKALAKETKDDAVHEMSVTARGLAKAAEILAGRFSLVATNVPFKETKQLVEPLQDFISECFSAGRVNLATAFVLRIRQFLSETGVAAIVTPHEWLFLKSYTETRETLLSETSWRLLVDLGEKAFQSPQAAGAFTALISFSNAKQAGVNLYAGWDATKIKMPADKALCLFNDEPHTVIQSDQLKNPDARIGFAAASGLPLLSKYAGAYVGLQNGDTPRFVGYFWEIPAFNAVWSCFQLPCDSTKSFGGREGMLRWDGGNGALVNSELAYTSTESRRS